MFWWKIDSLSLHSMSHPDYSSCVVIGCDKLGKSQAREEGIMRRQPIVSAPATKKLIKEHETIKAVNGRATVIIDAFSCPAMVGIHMMHYDYALNVCHEFVIHAARLAKAKRLK